MNFQRFIPTLQTAYTIKFFDDKKKTISTTLSTTLYNLEIY